jgi:hypothetical protein
MISEVIKKTIDFHLHLGDVIKSIRISETDLEVLKTETEDVTTCFGYPLIKDESTYIETERRY